MSQLFAKVLRQALATFDRKNAAIFNTNYTALKQLVDQLSARDLNLDMDLVSKEAFAIPNKAPCTYVHIFQNENVAMSVFILRSDYTMPLHDHPMMHGILKPLSGSLLVQSFTRTNPINEPDENYIKGAKEIQVKAEEPRILTAVSDSAELTPYERNYHEITALNGIAAFFDILSPPYEADMPVYGRRRCSFYRKVMKGDFYSGVPSVAVTATQLTLERIPSPLSYYCDTGGYDPPDFLLAEIYKYGATETT